MNRPVYTVQCVVKKHQNFIRLLQKTVNKKLGLQCHHAVDDINDHILIVTNTHSSAKHFLYHTKPNFIGILLFYFYY